LDRRALFIVPSPDDGTVRSNNWTVVPDYMPSIPCYAIAMGQIITGAEITA